VTIAEERINERMSLCLALVDETERIQVTRHGDRCKRIPLIYIPHKMMYLHKYILYRFIVKDAP
jgi:hypothetical protein